MNIRPLREKDLAALAEVFVRAYPAEPWTAGGARAYLTRFFEFEPGCCYAVEEDDGSVVGAVLAYSYFRADRPILFLQDLFVDPDFRHRGYATKLVETVRDSCAERPQVKVVPLVKADTAVLNFYHGLGFERTPVFSFIDEDF